MKHATVLLELMSVEAVPKVHPAHEYELPGAREHVFLANAEICLSTSIKAAGDHQVTIVKFHSCVIKSNRAAWLPNQMVQRKWQSNRSVLKE